MSDHPNYPNPKAPGNQSLFVCSIADGCPLECPSKHPRTHHDLFHNGLGCTSVVRWISAERVGFRTPRRCEDCGQDAGHCDFCGPDSNSYTPRQHEKGGAA